MRRMTIFGGLAALVLGVGVVAAASPAPGGSTTAPAATPVPAATPAPAAKSAAPATSWTATINPLVLGGTATVAKTSSGGMLTLKLTGMDPDQVWRIDVDAGSAAKVNESWEIFSASGSDLTRLAKDTVRLRLSAAQYLSFSQAINKTGILVLVSDGSRVSVAAIAKA